MLILPLVFSNRKTKFFIAPRLGSESERRKMETFELFVIKKFGWAPQILLSDLFITFYTIIRILNF